MRLLSLFLWMFYSVNVQAQHIDVATFGVVPDSFKDATAGVQQAIAACRDKPNAVISFQKGRYDFWPDQVEEHVYFITNSSTEDEYPSKKQKAGLFFKGMKNITIEGNDALFVFHGKMITWIFDGCENIRLQNVRIDYERPGMSEITIKEIGTGSITASVHPDSRFTITDGKLQWYGEKWVSSNFHAVLSDPATGVNLYSSWEPFLNSKAEVTGPFTVKFTGDFSNFKAKPGDVLSIRDRIRDHVGAFINRSKNISLHNVRMQYMHGLGIVSQFSENLYYDHVFIEPEKGSGRIMASSADGMQFSGCRGQIILDHCRFRGMHDDAVNVHGTHLQVTEIVSPASLKIRFMHGQTYGFEAFVSTDTVAFLNSASLKIFNMGIIKTAKLISEREMLVEFNSKVPDELKIGDALENVTWTPAFTLKNSRIEGTSTRGLLVTTRRKVRVENNVFYRTGMHAILIENDASGWFESGPVNDVTIQNNVFEECGYNSFPNNYVIHISPHNTRLVAGYQVHKNIRILNNTFKVYDYPLLSARSVDGLTFAGNKVIESDFMKAGEIRPSISLTASKGIQIADNDIIFKGQRKVEIEDMTAKDIRSDMKYHLKSGN